MEEEGLDLINQSQQESQQNQAAVMKYQKFLFDSFVELRVKLQKIVLPLNRLPQGAVYEQLCEASQDIKTNDEETVLNLKGFLCDLLQMNRVLLRKNASITEDSKKFNPNSDITVNEQSSSTDIWKEVQKSISCKRQWEDETTNYWAKRSQALAGGLSNKSFGAFNKDIPSQVNSILEDENRWRKRYSVLRGNYKIIGKEEGLPDEDGLIRDTNVYDDSEFYNTLLSYYTNTKETENNEASTIYRKSKINKKEVNRKASKGRRLRYQVHPKLLNFCAPEAYPPPPMDVQQLFSSLFGKTPK
ncbi:hypothetical protein WA158_000285 [Blastocystis sp. Blastoise]